MDSFHLTSYFTLLFIHSYLETHTSLEFPWQHALLISMLPPWILLFSLIFKFSNLYLFLRVWSSLLFSIALLDKSSIIPKAIVISSQSSFSYHPTPYVLPVFLSFIIHWVAHVGNILALIPSSPFFPHIPMMARFSCSSPKCLLKPWTSFYLFVQHTTLSFLNSCNRLVCFYFCFISIHSSGCRKKNLPATYSPV